MSVQDTGNRDLEWGPIVGLALAEDIGSGDVTTLSTMPTDARATGIILAKDTGVLSGVALGAYIFARVDPVITCEILLADGTPVTPGETIARLAGPARSVLVAERTVLNFMQRLSGIATITARYVAETQGTTTSIVDTRKTTPGMRSLEKAAVRHGGGRNHRFGLADGVLIKDNHLAAIGGPERVTVAICQARKLAPHTLRIEVEVTTLDELGEALAAGADIVLLDNMDTPTMQEAVRRRNRARPETLLEASGNITLPRIAEIAAAGLDMVSVGALTHSAPALDISLDLDIGT